MSISCIVNWTCNFLVGVSFPTMHAVFGPLCFVPFMIVLLLTLLYVIYALPETHGRTLEEIQHMARGAGVPATDVESMRARYAGAMGDTGGVGVAMGSYESMDMGLLKGRDSVLALKDMR